MDSHLVHMANDIARFHQAFSEDEAMQMVAEHINKNWAPSMRQKLFEVLSAKVPTRSPEYIIMCNPK